MAKSKKEKDDIVILRITEEGLDEAFSEIVKIKIQLKRERRKMKKKHLTIQEKYSSPNLKSKV